jgi:hypothetical protein
VQALFYGVHEMCNNICTLVPSYPPLAGLLSRGLFLKEDGVRIIHTENIKYAETGSCYWLVYRIYRYKIARYWSAVS